MNQILPNLKRYFLSTDCFKYIFLIFTMSICIPLFHEITSSIFKFVLVCGLFLIVYDFVKKKKFIRSRNSVLILFFLGSCFFSLLINKNQLSNLKAFIYTIIPLILFYSDYVDKDMVNIKNELRKISIIYCAITAVSSLISLFMFFIQFSRITESYTLGVRQGRLWGIYVSPNAGGIYALISVILSIFLIYSVKTNEKKEKNMIFTKIFCVLNILIEYMYISLTDSKGTELVVIFFSFIFTFLLYYFIDQKIYSSKPPKRIFVSSLIAILLSVSSLVLLRLTKQFLSFVPSFIDNF